MAELVDWLHHESITRAGTNSGTSYIPRLKTAKCPLCGKETDILIYNDGVLEGCRYCGVRPQVKTNADRIRSMTDEELAEWLVSIIECDDGCPCIKECGEKEEMGVCYPSMLEWLRKEVDNNAKDVNLSNRG